MNLPKLSPKYIDFFTEKASVEVLEGTTFAGKTTVGAIKFIIQIIASKKKIHILAGLDIGTIEKNIINPDSGLLDVFGPMVEYNPKGRDKETMPHLVVHGAQDKIVYVLGYDDRARWKKALGGQYGCVFVDEANIAQIDFVREVSIRYDYLLMTLNPDDPNLPIYDEYIDHTRPLPRWASDVPSELLEMLNKEPREGWVHWYFTFDDNVSITTEKREQLLSNTPKGTKLYKNKIQGLRGRATGLIFDLQPHNIITFDDAKKLRFKQFTAALDTSYSQNSDDTFSLMFGGITEDRKFVSLANVQYNNRDLTTPLSPSDIPPLLIQFLEAMRSLWGLARDVFIDSADQGTIIECGKYKRRHGCIYNFLPAWKKTTLIDRINLQIGWMAHGDYLILDSCKPYLSELDRYSWLEDKYAPEDRNDHATNANQYGWLPFKTMIGGDT